MIVRGTSRILNTIEGQSRIQGALNGENMISGNYYVGSEYEIRLQTGIILTGATVSIMVKNVSGSVIELEGEVEDLTTIKATLTAEANTAEGELKLQARAEFDDEDVRFGQTETIFMLQGFALA